MTWMSGIFLWGKCVISPFIIIHLKPLIHMNTLMMGFLFIFASVFLLSVIYISYWIVKIVSGKRKTEKYMIITRMLGDYWESLDPLPFETSVIRYYAYKKELLRQFNIYEFDFDKWQDETLYRRWKDQ